jgi:hypothetical protein
VVRTSHPHRHFFGDAQLSLELEMTSLRRVCHAADCSGKTNRPDLTLLNLSELVGNLSSGHTNIRKVDGRNKPESKI